MRKQLRALGGSLALVLTLAVLAACGSSEADDRGETTVDKASSLADLKLDDPVDLKVGLYNPNYGVHASILLAKNLGVFEDFGLNVEFENISATDGLPLLARGDLDIQEGTFGAGFFNGIEQGLEVRCLAWNTVSPPDGPEAFYARKGLFADPDNPTAEEIKGAVIGTAGGPTSTSAYGIELLLNDMFDLDITDVTLQQMASPEQLVALDSGAIDVGYLIAPFYLEAADRGITRLAAIPSPTQCAQAGPRVVDDTEVAAAYLAALQTTNEEYLGEGHLQRDEVVEALAEETGASPDEIRDYEPATFEIRSFEPSIIEGAQDLFRKLEVLEYDENLDYEEVVDGRAFDALP